MARSAAYARVKREVMAVAQAVPPGRVTTFAAIGAYLDVVPRQVAYLLSARDDDHRESVPWHRVVAEGGMLGRLVKRNAIGVSQAELLADEGVSLGPGGRVERFDEIFFPVTLASTGVAPGPRGSG